MPALHLEIDVITESVALTGVARRTFRGQWVVFYALLALRADAPGEGRLLAADELVAFGRWQHKRAASAGKEVARHLAALDAVSLSGLVAHAGKTRRWGLAAGVMVATTPSADEVARWVEGQRAVAPIPALGDLSRLVEATVALQRGEAERAHELAWEARIEGAHDAAWRAVIAGRAAQRADEADRIDTLERDLAGYGGAAVVAARARLTALRLFDQRFDDPDGHLGVLRGLAARLESGGDLGTLGAVLNVMGLMARRAGRAEEGLGPLRRACALFGICGDMPSLQGALFNLALCREEVLGARGQSPDDEAMGLIELCLAVCETFGVGRDSAQAEVTACRWALRRGERARARRYLSAAERILERLPSSFEQACYLRARAEIALIEGDSMAAVERDLRAALRLFSDAGDPFMAGKVAREIEALDHR